MKSIQDMMQQLGRETKNLIESCVELAWFMRGGISYNELLHMSAGERDVALQFINKRMEGVNKSTYPVY